MRKHPHPHARWSVTAAFVLFVVGLAPGLVIGSHASTLPLASPVSSAPPLDLAAMALTPLDLDGIGLTGFGQQTSSFLDLEEQAGHYALSGAAMTSGESDTDEVRAALSAAGFQRRYQRQLGRPSRPGSPPSRLRTFVAPYVIEYASVEGASAGFTLLETEVPEAEMTDVPGTRIIGDRSEITRFRHSTDNGEPYQALDLTFQVGNLVAGVTIGEFDGSEPDLATVETLGELLLAKVRLGQAGSGPGLSNVILRLEGPDIETRSDEYGRLDGQTLPNYAETPEEFADRAGRYGDALVVYGVGQIIARGGPARTDDTRFGALLYQFASEQDAAGWLESGVERAEQSPNIIEAIPVAGAATIGDASGTLAIASERGGAGTARGYLVETQVGEWIAQVQMLGIPGVPQVAVEALARAQVTCLQSGSCPGQAPPASLEEVATPVASPGSGTPLSASQSCSATGVSASTPVAGTQQPLPAIDTDVESTTSSSTPPNIVVINTDDLDARSVACMPHVQSLLAQDGVTFANAFVTTPLCCPSRASLLRGQYAHSHGVLCNTGDSGGFPTFYRLGDEDSTVATWLQDAGYRTALLGKYLNRYPKGAAESYVPPGWDEWSAFASSDENEGGSYYSGYALNENGTTVRYGQQPSDYSTDVLAAKAIDFVDRTAAAGNPFFLYIAPYAPHGPSTPASRHTGAFADTPAPRVPSFEEPDVSDKPAWVQALPGSMTTRLRSSTITISGGCDHCWQSTRWSPRLSKPLMPTVSWTIPTSCSRRTTATSSASTESRSASRRHMTNRSAFP